MALTSMDNGQPAVFAPGQPERNLLIRTAVAGVSGHAGTMTAPVQPASALPTFKIGE